ncbi:MAG: EamA family transporter [Bryobacteraceae bacterium]
MTWVIWSLLSAFFAAATAILAKIGVSGVDSNLATAIRTSVVLVFAWMLVALTNGVSSMSTISSRTWLFLSLSGIATGLSWLCYFRALQLGPASKVAPIDKLSVVLVIIAAAIFLREPVSLTTAIGGALVLAGVLTLAFA